MIIMRSYGNSRILMCNTAWVLSHLIKNTNPRLVGTLACAAGVLGIYAVFRDITQKESYILSIPKKIKDIFLIKETELIIVSKEKNDDVLKKVSEKINYPVIAQALAISALLLFTFSSPNLCDGVRPIL